MMLMNSLKYLMKYSPPKEMHNHFDLINFNYTNINSDYSKIFKNVDNFKFVHGDIYSNIIFGVYSTLMNPFLPNFIFSKTYRSLKILNSNFKLDKSINYIKFFGHSLSEADYAYFYNIFDY